MSSSAGRSNELADARRAAVGALAEANRAELGQRSNGRRKLLADGVHAGNDGRADSAEPDEQNAEFPCGRRNFNGFFTVPDYIKQDIHRSRA